MDVSYYNTSIYKMQSRVIHNNNPNDDRYKTVKSNVGNINCMRLGPQQWVWKWYTLLFYRETFMPVLTYTRCGTCFAWREKPKSHGKVTREEEASISKGIPNPTSCRKDYLSHTHLFHTLWPFGWWSELCGQFLKWLTMPSH